MILWIKLYSEYIFIFILLKLQRNVNINFIVLVTQKNVQKH